MSAPSILAPIFDAAIAKLNAQGFKSYDEDQDSCMYRYNGGACLFGHMIADEHYSPLLDGCGDAGTNVHAGDPSVRAALLKSTGVDFNEVLGSHDLSQLQGIHDSAWEPGENMKALIIEERPDLAAKIWGDAIIEEGEHA